MSMIADGTGPATAQELVNEMWDYYRGWGETWLNEARYAAIGLTNITIEPVNFSVTYNPGEWLPQFNRPTRPTVPSLPGITTSPVPVPDLDPVTLRDIGDAPEEPDLSVLATYAPPSPPSTPLPTAPADTTPTLDPIVVPDRPDVPLPEVPELYDITLPEIPAINLPAFQGERPTFDIPLPEDGQLAFTEVPYASELLDALTAKLRQMTQDGLVLAPEAETAIFDRARAREDRLSRKLVQEISEDMSARGLTEPNGVLPMRLRQAREANRDAAHGLNRDLAIKRYEEAIEGVKFAIGQGITLENTLIQQNLAINERALRVAIFVREYALTRVQTLVAIAGLQRDLYLADAQVWEQQIRGELAKLEVLKAEIDAQRLVGEVNKTLVDLYESRWRAVATAIDAYKADVEAAKTKGEINNQRIEAAKLILERYSIEVEGYGKVQEAFRTRVEAAQGTLRHAETLSNIYATHMQGYRTRGEAYFNEGRFQIERNGQTLERFRSELAGADQDLRAQLGQLEGRIRALAAETDLYQADGAIAQAESAALDRNVQLRIENERNRTSVALEQSRIRIEQAVKNAEILLEGLKAKAQTLAQLAAASQSGVNAGASLSGSLGTSFSYGRSLSWSGEVADHSGIGF